jgi:hypothetical protein
LFGMVDGDGRFRIDEVPPGDYVEHALKESQYFITLRQDGNEFTGGLIRILPGSAPVLDIELRRATAAIEVKVEGESEYHSIVIVPTDGWDHHYSWITELTAGSGGSKVVPVVRLGRYLSFATLNLSGYEIRPWRDELRRHAKQAVSVDAGRFG